ncbi:hypothetical protein LSH36_230g06014 [Paralvinella palmiformis]|uniref:Uncharacterized protein n=1 Tax=Paralvinella palmiformis TaxID=53620 RepID=A0AAD9JMI2_9ANNE|nr:hypothetical protein LSH36_230g06014 [Paralvinella palmiformis]
MSVPEEVNVAFGSGMNREILPLGIPQNRLGNILIPISGDPYLAPGRHENEYFTSFLHQVTSRITSKRGYSLGARTEERMKDNTDLFSPTATTYQKDCSTERVFKTTYKAFNAGAPRFQVWKRDIDWVTPGPAAYEHNVVRNRQVRWDQYFGGTPINFPSITQPSTISRNTGKLPTTKEEKIYQRKLAYLKMYFD